MQTGFSMLEAGGVARKSLVESILLKNVIDASVCAICFYLVGYGFAFGDGGYAPGFAGASGFALNQQPKFQQWVFQWAFASVSTTIVSGAMAERTRVRAYIYYSIIMSAFTYPVAAHWVWSNDGWMSSHKDDESQILLANGLIDWAGSGVVHLVGGTAGAVGAFIVKPRMGRYEDLYERRGMFKPQSIGWMSLGTMILWFCWYGFNCGSTLKVSGQDSVIGLIAMCTTLSASMSGITSLMLTKFVDKTWSVVALLNGILCGLVSITAGCSVVAPWGALVIGFIAGGIYFLGVKLITKIHLDDVLETVVVHGMGGLWGLIAVGLFATKENVMNAYGRDKYAGLFTGGGGEQLAMQLIGVVVLFVWSFVCSGSLFLVLNYFKQLRISERYEKSILEEDVTRRLQRVLSMKMAHNWQSSTDSLYVQNIDDNDVEASRSIVQNNNGNGADVPRNDFSVTVETTTNSSTPRIPIRNYENGRSVETTAFGSKKAIDSGSSTYNNNYHHHNNNNNNNNSCNQSIQMTTYIGSEDDNDTSDSSSDVESNSYTPPEVDTVRKKKRSTTKPPPGRAHKKRKKNNNNNNLKEV
eukprot:TRINITY_DN720_c3_g1_i2.p1 TRINITY_DN720_c3_g1~~TRINITY_DN720_c3_g1_i2.p1  ORF type:complete len:582 (-),score=147.14 TRINITY_DN720_c3_g1_i2:275-2020(-)